MLTLERWLHMNDVMMNNGPTEALVHAKCIHCALGYYQSQFERNRDAQASLCGTKCFIICAQFNLLLGKNI